MYDAWDEPNPAKRIALAHEALKLSTLCADAYVLLAQEEADTVKRALEFYQQGVNAGEKALGADYFQENTGYFWGLLETRPYMRARQGLAETLWRLKRYEEAIQHFRELLKLNPGDNQGNRYALLALLMQLERYDEARSLLEQYEDEWSAVWLYSRVLLEFEKHEESTAASRALSCSGGTLNSGYSFRYGSGSIAMTANWLALYMVVCSFRQRLFGRDMRPNPCIQAPRR
jgi:tetratricopeptide (TPR) repeat protein